MRTGPFQIVHLCRATKTDRNLLGLNSEIVLKSSFGNEGRWPLQNVITKKRPMFRYYFSDGLDGTAQFRGRLLGAEWSELNASAREGGVRKREVASWNAARSTV